MKIGELAAATDTAVETIRFYEREGLIPLPARTESNYRSYDAGHAQRLVFIRRCRALDMGLDETRSLLRLLDQPAAPCGEVNSVLDEHIGHVVQRRRELGILEKQLRELRAHCAADGSIRRCGILEVLQDAAAGPARSPPANPSAHVGPVHGRPQRSAGR